MPESEHAFLGLLGLFGFASSPSRRRASLKGYGVNLCSAYGHVAFKGGQGKGCGIGNIGDLNGISWFYAAQP